MTAAILPGVSWAEIHRAMRHKVAPERIALLLEMHLAQHGGAGW